MCTTVSLGYDWELGSVRRRILNFVRLWKHAIDTSQMHECLVRVALRA